MISKSVFIKKKRIMEQFSLEKYLANPSRKVVTRNGRNVRIVCTDRKYKVYPIIALEEIPDDNSEYVYAFTKDGNYEIDDLSIHDLFFAPEKHEGWINIFKGEDFYHTFIYNSKEDAEEFGKQCKSYITTVKIEWEE